jgi:hypothetical protein
VILNLNLSKCIPPQYVQQAPRNLNDYKKWRAHEFMNFMLYFAIPIFKDVIDEKYFNHLLLLIIPLEYLLSKQIDKNKLEMINLSLNNFVKDLNCLYDRHIMLSGTHELLHLVLCTETIGPLNDSSNFPFEELNRIFTTKVKSQDLVGDEFKKLNNASKNLHFNISKLKNSECKYTTFIKQHTLSNTSNKKLKLNIEKDYLKVGRKFNFNLEVLNNMIISFLSEKRIDMNNILFYERIYYNNIVYSVYFNDTKFANDLIGNSNKFGKIIFIIKSNGIFYFLCKSLILLNNNICFNLLNSHFSLYSLSNSLFLIDQTKFRYLKKYFYYKSNENSFLINNFTSSHLFS